VWVSFALAVGASVGADTIFTIARYLLWRAFRVVQSRDQAKLKVKGLKTDGGSVTSITGEPTSVRRVVFAVLAASGTSDTAVSAELLRMAAGTDPSAALPTDAADSDPTGEPRDSDLP
jgi:hypothetical protein